MVVGRDVDLETHYFKNYSVSYERFDREIPQAAAPTRDIIWMLLRWSWSEPWNDSAQADLTSARAIPSHCRCC